MIKKPILTWINRKKYKNGKHYEYLSVYYQRYKELNVILKVVKLNSTKTQNIRTFEKND